MLKILFTIIFFSFNFILYAFPADLGTIKSLNNIDPIINIRVSAYNNLCYDQKYITISSYDQTSGIISIPTNEILTALYPQFMPIKLKLFVEIDCSSTGIYKELAIIFHSPKKNNFIFSIKHFLNPIN